MNRQSGFTLLELVATMLVLGILMAGVVTDLSARTRVYVQQSLFQTMEQNLRHGRNTVADALRVAGDGVPDSDISAWIPWVSGFGSNPKIIEGGSDVLSVARCTPLPVAMMWLDAAEGATDIKVVSQVPGRSVGDLLDNGAKRLIFLGDQESAHIASVGGGGWLTIDTDPMTAGNQGLSRAHLWENELCRVDVLTFDVAVDPATGRSQLRVDYNLGDGPQVVAEDIIDLQVDEVVAGEHYAISLTAETERADPLTGQVATRTLKTDVMARNLVLGGG